MSQAIEMSNLDDSQSPLKSASGAHETGYQRPANKF